MTDAERLALATAGPDELKGRIATDIDAYSMGGPDLEIEHLDLVSDDWREVVSEFWTEARRARDAKLKAALAAKPEPIVVTRRLPPTEPKAEPEPLPHAIAGLAA